MTRQILKMSAGGKTFSVIYNEGKTNPFCIYRHTWELRECGYGMSERKRIEVKYADVKSCLIYLAQQF